MAQAACPTGAEVAPEPLPGAEPTRGDAAAQVRTDTPHKETPTWHRLACLHRVEVPPGLLPGDELVQDDAVRVHVALFIAPVRAQDLGRHPLRHHGNIMIGIFV